MQTEDDTPKPEDSPEQMTGEGCLGATCSACGQEWYAGAEAMCIRREKCGFRAMRVHSVQSPRAMDGGWIKATDINRPGGWYWTRLGADDESCPQVVFIDMDNDGDAAPDFRVVCMGESSRTAKRLKQWADREWEFMEIPLPNSIIKPHA